MADANSGGKVSRILGQYVIKYYFQFKVSLIVFGIIGVTSFVLWLEASLAINRMISSGIVSSEDAIQQMRLISAILGKTGMLVSSVTFALALFLSHFVAGPVYRFEKIFQEMQQGNLGVFVRVRKNDEFQDTAEILNHSLGSLRNKLQKERESMSAILMQALKGLEETGRGEDASRLRQAFEELKANPASIKIPAPK